MDLEETCRQAVHALRAIGARAEAQRLTRALETPEDVGALLAAAGEGVRAIESRLPIHDAVLSSMILVAAENLTKAIHDATPETGPIDVN